MRQGRRDFSFSSIHTTTAPITLPLLRLKVIFFVSVRLNCYVCSGVYTLFAVRKWGDLLLNIETLNTTNSLASALRKKTSSQTQSVSIQMSKPIMSEKIFNHAFFFARASATIIQLQFYNLFFLHTLI